MKTSSIGCLCRFVSVCIGEVPVPNDKETEEGGDMDKEEEVYVKQASSKEGVMRPQ